MVAELSVSLHPPGKNSSAEVKVTPGKAGGLFIGAPSKGLFMSPLKGAILLPSYERDQSIFSWSRRWSSFSWSRMYLRTISSSRPTVDTK